MVVAYLLTLSVLADTDMASKFENGVAPPGTDVMGNRIATVGGIVAGGCSWVAAVTGRMVLPIVLVFIASAPFALLSLVALQLAF
ncbi:hypothetical protein [Mycolicibacterium fortuitum]|uniref:hypothetical protein n=1 Tax=Mycolicibacterium fortuitum TaxID=1766 RepID=UPI000B2CA1E8|nr:hypothetical protein [Mycolicibacterium fortuitum]